MEGNYAAELFMGFGKATNGAAQVLFGRNGFVKVTPQRLRKSGGLGLLRCRGPRFRGDAQGVNMENRFKVENPQLHCPTHYGVFSSGV